MPYSVKVVQDRGTRHVRALVTEHVVHILPISLLIHTASSMHLARGEVQVKEAYPHAVYLLDPDVHAWWCVEVFCRVGIFCGPRTGRYQDTEYTRHTDSSHAPFSIVRLYLWVSVPMGEPVTSIKHIYSSPTSDLCRSLYTVIQCDIVQNMSIM